MIHIDPSAIALNDSMMKRLESRWINRHRAREEEATQKNGTPLIIEGIGVTFDEPILAADGAILVIEKGAFDAHITSGARSESWFGHDGKDVIDSSDDDLQLITTDKFLAFRYRPSAKYADLVRRKIKTGQQSAVSIGFTHKKSRTERWDKHDVIFVEEAECRELSLVGEGADSGAFARIVERENPPPLRDSVNTADFKVDQLAHNAKALARSLKTIDDHIANRVTLLEHRQQQRTGPKVARSYSLNELNRLATLDTERLQSEARERHRVY